MIVLQSLLITENNNFIIIIIISFNMLAVIYAHMTIGTLFCSNVTTVYILYCQLNVNTQLLKVDNYYLERQWYICLSRRWWKYNRSKSENSAWSVPVVCPFILVANDILLGMHMKTIHVYLGDTQTHRYVTRVQHHTITRSQKLLSWRLKRHSFPLCFWLRIVENPFMEWPRN